MKPFLLLVSVTLSTQQNALFQSHSTIPVAYKAQYSDRPKLDLNKKATNLQTSFSPLERYYN